MQQTYYGLIYKAISPSNKVYIGQTRNSLKKRINNHRYYCKFSKRLFYKAINKYGFDNFKWEIIDYASDIKDLNEKEIYWIEFFKCNTRKYGYKYGYNLSPGGALFTQKKALTEEHKRKIGLANKNKKLSQETKLKISKAKIGLPVWISGKTKNDFSENHIKALLEGQRKRKLKPNYIPPMLGKKRTEEQKLKISQATKLAMQNPEIRKKCSHKHSEEDKLKISIATKLAMQNPEVKEKMRIAKLKRKIK